MKPELFPPHYTTQDAPGVVTYRDGKLLVGKIVVRNACKKCGTYLDVHGPECTYDYSGGA